jgi:hypothetical protein
MRNLRSATDCEDEVASEPRDGLCCEDILFASVLERNGIP